MAGKDIKMNMINGVLPDVSDTLTGWEVDIEGVFVEQETVDDEIIEEKTIKRLKGTLQPLRTQEVVLKPEGQRAWEWYQIHVKSSYPLLRTEQKIRIANTNYKIMAVKDYTLYGYIEYHTVKDYE